MLAQMTARQAAEWYAYATIEQVGNPAEVKSKEGEAKARRAKIESGFRSLMEKQGSGKSR